MNPSDPDMPSNPEPGADRSSTSGEDAAAKPARKRRAPRKAAAAGEAAAAGTEAASAGPGQAALFGADAASPGDGPAAGGGAAESGPRGAEPARPGGGEGGEAAAAAEGERKRRNRRRGRNKDRVRSQAPGPEGAPAGLVALPPADVGELFAQVVSGAFDTEAPPEADPTLPLEGSAEPAMTAAVPTGEQAPIDGEAPAPAQDARPGEPPVPGPREPQPTGEPGDLFDTQQVEGHAIDSRSAPAAPRAGESAPSLPFDGDGPPQSKRVLSPDADAPKLHKVLAQSGVGSRRDLEQMIAEGRVSVNGEAAHTGQRISFGDRIAIDGKPVKVRIAPPPARVIAYHKPVGEVVTHDDPQQRPTVFRRLPRLPMGKWQSVGRLDINTEGLLLFTTSGELANQLMHPRFGLEREYAVRVLGILDDEARARLLAGVEIDGQKAAFLSIEDGGGEGSNHWYRVVIAEGRNREVRKLFDAAGLTVSRLIRIRYGSVVLPRGLKRGVWVELPEADLRTLRRMTGTGRPVREARGEDEGPGAKPVRGKRGKRSRGGARRDGEGAPLPGQQPGFEHKRPAREPRGPKREPVEGGRIPNPLQQTFDKRAIREARAPRRDLGEDGPIPNPLQQTFDKRAMREDRGPSRDYGEDGPIPNPLQQTFDKRAMRDAAAVRRDPGEDGPIPNPLQQTFDKRAMRAASTPRRDPGEDGPIPNPLQQTFDKRFAQKPRGVQGGRAKKAGGGGGAAKQPDPMKTSVGYIGADAFRKGGGRGGRGGPGGGRGGGQGGGGGRGGGGRGR